LCSSNKDGFDSEEVSKSLIGNVQKRLSEKRVAERSAAFSKSFFMDTSFSFAVEYPFNPSDVALKELTFPDSFNINNLVKRFQLALETIIN
jgi:hypothetical protein